MHLPVGLDDLANAPGRGLLLLVDGGRGHEALHVPLVAVEEKPHQGLGVVGLVLDVGEHEETRLLSGRDHRRHLPT